MDRKINTIRTWLQRLSKITLFSYLILQLFSCSAGGEKKKAVLIFNKNKINQSSANEATDLLRGYIVQNGISVDTTSNPAYFTEDSLKNYGLVVFLRTSQDVLNTRQQNEFERFVQAGGGFMGVHSSNSSKYQWPWLNAMLGAKLSNSNPDIAQPSKVNFHINNKERTFDLKHKIEAESWTQQDKVLEVQDFATENQVLVETEDKEPVTWYRKYDGGNMFYTTAGGANESFNNQHFLKHILTGIEYLLKGPALNYAKAHTQRTPEDNRFLPIVLDTYLNEPIEMEIMKDGRVLFIERNGKIKLYDPKEAETKTLAELDVHTTGNYEDGLLGLELDPFFDTNNYIYLYYSPVGEKSVQNLSRFKLLGGDSLLMSSEKVVLEVPVQRETCCHSAGNIYFGPDGYLYLTTGDNTSSKESDGFTPIDERPGRAPFDAQKSSSNTHDLRGKILRIRIEPDGTYSIPDGNLFPKDGSQGRPEIYIMGVRNPYRMTMDKRGYVYWGDVGPDGGKTTERGPQSYDEWNQAKAPGNYGWPYFVADNKAYAHFNFETNEVGPKFDPDRPINNSPNNYGSKELPPAKGAMIWYPYGNSKEFPMLGTGSRASMIGPFFYVEDYKKSPHRFPSYYNGKLFIVEWARSWIKVLSFTKEGDLLKIEPFLPYYDFAHPIDVKFGPDGAMYVLTYGANYFAQNPDAQLVKIDYAEGNREPIAIIDIDKMVGAAPFKVSLSGTRSFDYDKNDQLQYEWESGTGEVSHEEVAEFVYTEPGIYRPTLTVTDNHGGKATAEVEIKVGNETPKIAITVGPNESFYFDKTTYYYSVAVNDKEDEALENGIAENDVFFAIDYLPEGRDLALLASNSEKAERTSARFIRGKNLIENSDCGSCHAMDKKSIGPSWMEVSERYQSDDAIVKMLSNKIIQGGNGNWGTTMMAAHPQHTLEEAKQMTEYILSIDKEQANKLPLKGTWVPQEHLDKGGTGTYVFTASYTDKGNQYTGRLTGRKSLFLRHPKVQAEDFDSSKSVARRTAQGEGVDFVGDIKNGSYFSFENIDLKGVQGLVIKAAARNNGGRIEVRLNSPTGKLIGFVDVSPVSHKKWREITLPIESTEGVNDIFFVFKNENVKDDNLMVVDWIYFGNKEKI